jgi:nicotinic acid phosphoribosyltransferase
VAAALAEVGACEALISLAINPGAELLEFSIRRMIERHGQEADLRAALLARANLSAALRSDLAGAAAKALSLCANDDETKTCREFTLEGIGQTSSGYAPNQRQEDPCSSRC